MAQRLHRDYTPDPRDGDYRMVLAKAGDAVMFHCLTMHAGGVMQSGRPRPRRWVCPNGRRTSSTRRPLICAGCWQVRATVWPSTPMASQGPDAHRRSSATEVVDDRCRMHFDDVPELCCQYAFVRGGHIRRTGPVHDGRNSPPPP
jgi:hypothetical protein